MCKSKIVLFVLILSNTGLIAWRANTHSPNWDEVGHLPSGLSHWQLGDFQLYSVNPPLIRMVASIPVCLAQPETDWALRENSQVSQRHEFAVGLRFLEANGFDSFWYFSLARWACIPFSWLGAVMCYLWGRDLYGDRSGAAAAAIWCFSPSVLAYGAMITPAIGATAIGLVAHYAFWKWLRRPMWDVTILVGVIFGIVQLTKTTWLLLYGVWPLLMLAYCLRYDWQKKLRAVTQLVVIFAMSIVTINVGYGFDGSFKLLGEYEFASEILRGRPLGNSANRFEGTILAPIPVPLPYQYVRGIDLQKLDFEKRLSSYLRGEWKKGGWWYFYLYALAIKVPIGIFVLAVCRLYSQKRTGMTWRDELVFLAPGLIILAFVSSQTGFNHHLRYVMPFIATIFIVASSVFSRRGIPRVQRFAVAMLVWLAASSLWVWPHNLSYFNELIGGPMNGHLHLGGTDIDTNMDCGQDLLYLRRWVKKQSDYVAVGFRGAVRPAIAGISRDDIPVSVMGKQPTNLPSGYYALSTCRLHQRDGSFEYFADFDPVSRVGYSILIFDLRAGKNGADKTEPP